MRCPLPLVIDTDGGTDDAVAIWWALTEPGVELVALIATGGNVSRDIAATNCNRILTAAGRLGIPIALGAEGPMGGTPVLLVPALPFTAKTGWAATPHRGRWATSLPSRSSDHLSVSPHGRPTRRTCARHHRAGEHARRSPPD
ncbi:MAG: nucleoside hydrolase [Actinobacteria bacterium]|nr:nucleoside hydrolase [Actinomycetota bacterium]